MQYGNIQGQIQRLMKKSRVPKQSQSTGRQYVVMLGYLSVSCARMSLPISVFLQHVFHLIKEYLHSLLQFPLLVMQGC